MLLIIHNLPPNTRYTDVKALINDKCGLTEMIVDNLVGEGNGTKVTVGLADEGDAAILVRKINGLYVSNHQLYVEDVRQKKATEQPYKPSSISNQYRQEQYIQSPSTQFYEQREPMQFRSQPPMSMETQLPARPPAPNFGVPFYMTAQNKNVGNNLQFMVQYPKVQGSMGNESHQGRDVGFDRQYEGRKRDQTMSPDRGPHKEHSPRGLSKWNESDCNRAGRRSRDTSAQRDHRHDADQSYKHKSYRDTFQSRSKQDFVTNKQNNNRFEKPGRHEPTWERPNRSTFGEQNDYRFNNRNNDIQERRNNQEREPQRFGNNNFSQSRGSDNASRPAYLIKKRPYESPDKNNFSPQNKKFGSNQQFDSRNQQGAPGSSFSNNYQNKKNPSFSNNYQNKKNPYLNKFATRPSMQQNRPHIQPKGLHMQSFTPQTQPKGLQKNEKQWQQNIQPMKQLKKQTNFAKDRSAPTDIKKTTEEMLARHKAWRVQAAAVIATQILNNVGKMRSKRDPILIILKACVRARIDVISGDDMSLTLRDMLFNYREKFKDDDAFYNAVLKKAENGELDEFETGKRGDERGATAVIKKSDIKPKLQFIGKPPAKVPSPGSNERLPKYPDGNKKVLSQLKQAQKDELVNESLYNLDAEHEKAFNEEMATLDKLMKQELETHGNETEKSLSKFMNDVCVPDLRKILGLHIKKRILDVRTNLSVRVICPYKAPKRDLLEAFLKDYGVVSLKASDKTKNVLIAICDTYESFDALCKKESTFFDDLKVSFKPLNLTGPPKKIKFKKQTVGVSKINTTECEKGNDKVSVNIENKNGKDNINEGNEDSKENEGQKISDVQKFQAKENSECEIVPSMKSDDIIVIEDLKADDEEIKVLNDTPVGNADCQVTGEDVLSACKDPETGGDDRVTFNNGKVVNTNSEVIGQDVATITDNINIADDDLEDF